MNQYWGYRYRAWQHLFYFQMSLLLLYRSCPSTILPGHHLHSELQVAPCTHSTLVKQTDGLYQPGQDDVNLMMIHHTASMYWALSLYSCTLPETITSGRGGLFEQFNEFLEVLFGDLIGSLGPFLILRGICY